MLVPSWLGELAGSSRPPLGARANALAEGGPNLMHRVNDEWHIHGQKLLVFGSITDNMPSSCRSLVLQRGEPIFRLTGLASPELRLWTVFVPFTSALR